MRISDTTLWDFYNEQGVRQRLLMISPDSRRPLKIHTPQTCFTVFLGPHSLNSGGETFTPKFGGYGLRRSYVNACSVSVSLSFSTLRPPCPSCGHAQEECMEFAPENVEQHSGVPKPSAICHSVAAVVAWFLTSPSSGRAKEGAKMLVAERLPLQRACLKTRRGSNLSSSGRAAASMRRHDRASRGIWVSRHSCWQVHYSPCHLPWRLAGHALISEGEKPPKIRRKKVPRNKVPWNFWPSSHWKDRK